MVYLTSRPIVLAPKTRAFLASTQQDGETLPLGPLQCCLESVSGVLWREVRAMRAAVCLSSGRALGHTQPYPTQPTPFNTFQPHPTSPKPNPVACVRVRDPGT